MSTTHIDTHVPCPICGKPFEPQSLRRGGSPLDNHVRVAHKEQISPTERRILKLILAGMSNEQIADQVNWPNGAKLRTIISRIHKKLGLDNPRQMLPRLEELRAIADL